MIQPRKTVQQLLAYRPPLEGRRQYTRLDFNENTTGFPEACTGFPTDLLTAYPEYQAFLEALATAWDIPVERLMITNGSDEALFVVAFTFIEPDTDRAITATPTFALIPHYLKLVQSRLIELPYGPDYQYDVAAIEAELAQGVKLAVFASPDNPVGAMLPAEQVKDWCARYPDTLFVIDEAYSEYAGETVLPLTEQFENLLVTRTFSKAWGLAGLRLGVVIGHPSLITAMQRVRSPYSVNTMALEAAQRLLPRQEDVQRYARQVMARKADVIQAIEALGYRVVPGRANFFLLAVGWQAPAFCEFFRRQGILLRDHSRHPRLPGMVRISVGSEAEMQLFLQCLEAYRQRQVLLFDMDGTLVDTRQSFDTTIAGLVEKYSGHPLPAEELAALRAEGGFNDDWDATVELLHRRGVEKTYDEISPEATQLYLKLAPRTETWLVEPETLERLARRHRLAVVTGRSRAEFDPVWKDRFEPFFELVFCQDDDPQAAKKPEPDLLRAALQQLGAEGGVYVGNSVDDMHAARAAGLQAIGVTTTHSADVLSFAGAETVVSDLNELGGLLAP